MKYLIFLCPICLLNNFLSFQLFVFSALWSSQPFELPSFLVSKLFGPPKMSLVLRPPVAWSLILRTGELTHSLNWLAGRKTRDGDDGGTRDGEEDEQLLHVLQLLVLLCVMYFDCLHSASLPPQNIDDDEDTCTRPPVASDMRRGSKARKWRRESKGSSSRENTFCSSISLKEYIAVRYPDLHVLGKPLALLNLFHSCTKHCMISLL